MSIMDIRCDNHATLMRFESPREMTELTIIVFRFIVVRRCRPSHLGCRGLQFPHPGGYCVEYPDETVVL